jgi:hypothetical protein
MKREDLILRIKELQRIQELATIDGITYQIVQDRINMYESDLRLAS